MENHLSREQMLKYRDRELVPVELAAADQHLAKCVECRTTLGGLANGAALLAAVGAARKEHLSYEQMDAWVEDTLDPSERELVSAHIGLCDPCAGQLKAYESYAPAMSVAIPPPARPFKSWPDKLRGFFLTPRFVMIATAALAIAVLSPLVIRRAAGPADRLSSLRPPSLGDLPPNPDSTLVYPVSEAIEERQPILEWSGGDPAGVTVVDSARKVVAQTSQVSGTQWLVPVPLDRGAVYFWEVRTAAGAREASFRVLSETDEKTLAAARASQAGATAIGEMALRMGALSEAQRQFESAVKQSPGDSAAADRLREVKRLRGR